jgi:hypothetical protein
MHRIVLVLFGVLIAAASGCGPGEVHAQRETDPAKERLLAVMRAYGLFSTFEHGPPDSANDLRPILAKDGQTDDVFVSPRDGQPFVVCWGFDLSAPKPPGSPPLVLAYEKTGKDGQRYVLTTFRQVELVSDEDFRKREFPPGFKPSS